MSDVEDRQYEDHKFSMLQRLIFKVEHKLERLSELEIKLEHLSEAHSQHLRDAKESERVRDEEGRLALAQAAADRAAAEAAVKMAVELHKKEEQAERSNTAGKR